MQRAAKQRQCAAPRHDEDWERWYVRGVIYGCNTWRHFVRFCISVVTLAASSALFYPPRAPLVMPRSLRAPVDFPWLINPDEISILALLSFLSFLGELVRLSLFFEEKTNPSRPNHRNNGNRHNILTDKNSTHCGHFIIDIYYNR